MSMREVRRVYGVSCEAIRQDEAQAMRELRKPKNSKRLRQFLPEEDRIYSMGLVGNGVDQFNRPGTVPRKWW